MTTTSRLHSAFVWLFIVATPLAAWAQTSLTNGLVAFYPFNGNASDVTGHGYDGTANGASLTSDRFNLPNSAYSFNGVSDYIQIGQKFSDMTNLTISAWVQYTSGSYQNGQGTIFDDSDTAASNDFEFGMRDASHAIIVATKNGYSLTQNAALGQNISNEWVQLAWVVSGSGSTVYLNGNSVYSTSQSGNNTGLHALPVIGATASQKPFVAFFGGKIDDLRVYNRALSPSEIQQLYQSESGPEVGVIRAVKPVFSRLTVGATYQLQVSGDLNTWLDYGGPFTATNATEVYPQYWDVNNWNDLFFRLQIVP